MTLDNVFALLQNKSFYMFFTFMSWKMTFSSKEVFLFLTFDVQAKIRLRENLRSVLHQNEWIFRIRNLLA